ncbi:hypothetical protein JRO89_XS12G0050300 [Xanthoceras sorbifolium]|uniref:Uncharacterized protein n=1 Tax=Xanthoceras sorbifolium TaxID=99658 RepID=A0ABQ8HB56_9ROSI|nr:hypothetical protein JRO89_XS12G0050300 [Xanthoceras sorbifolium]
MLRRTSSSLLPLAIRIVGSPRTFRSAISAVLGAEKYSFRRSNVVPFQQFSTKPSSDENLIQVLESEIDCAEQPTVSYRFNNRYTIPLVVSITRGSGTCLEFGATASPDEIQIDSLSIKQPEASEDQIAYEGPDFE